MHSLIACAGVHPDGHLWMLSSFEGIDKNGRRYLVRCHTWGEPQEIKQLIADRRAEYAQRSMPRRVRWPEFWTCEER